MVSSTPRGYSALQIGLHWIVAALVALQFLASEGIESAWRAFVRQQPVEPWSVGVVLHVTAGLLILAFVIWRITLRLTRGAPASPDGEPRIMRIIAHATHGLLYLLLIGLPISGSAAWFLGVEPAIAAHLLGKTVLLVLIGLHVAGALFQQFVMRSDVLKRMLVTAD